MNPILFECQNLCAEYERQSILKGISFTLHKGENLLISGSNGSGKSTLLKCILGIHPLLGGSVSFPSHPSIGYLSQSTPTQKNFPASVSEVVLSGSVKSSSPFVRRSEKQECLFLLDQLGIADLAKKSFSTLSGGQQQRVLLARALMAGSEMLFLDEPDTGLDPTSLARLYETLGHLVKHHHLSVVIISHNMAAALNLCNTVLHLDEGEIAFWGTSAEYQNSPVGQSHMGGIHHV